MGERRTTAMVFRVTIGIISIVLACATTPSYVAYHNYYRKLHGLNDLEYDATVEAQAQSWATSMAPTGGPCNQHSSGNPYGENLAWQSGGGATVDSSYLDAAQMWYGEVKDWNFPTSAPTGGTTGHFTQVTWAASTKVGCGRTQGAGGTCTVCNYSPAGNYAGQYAANIQDCDTSIAFKCTTMKSCIPTAERCNGVDDQCGVGGAMWMGTRFYNSNSDDEASCPSTSPTPACTNTDGTVANTASCTCNAGTCASYSCSPGPGAGTTCLAGQFCKSASSECSGAANSGNTPTTSAPTTPTSGGGTPVPTSTPTQAPTQASTVTVYHTITFSSTLTTAQQETVRLAYATLLTSTFSSTASGWTVTISAARRADYTLTVTGSASNSSAFIAASESSSSSFNTALSSSLATAGVPSTSIADYSVSISSSDEGSSGGLSGGETAIVVFFVLIVVIGLIVAVVVFFVLKGQKTDSNTAGGSKGEEAGPVSFLEASSSTHVDLKQDVSSSDGAQHNGI